MAANELREYRQALTEKLIEQLKEGTAPWQKPWEARTGADRLPYNAVTGKPYRGINSLWLSSVAMANGFDDPRWATFKQAQSQDWQIRKGSKGVRIEYYVFTEQRGVTDAQGRPVLDEEGKQKKITVELDRPIRTTAVVFHVSQMDNVPELDRGPRQYEWNPVERAEQILEASGARILHDQNDRAFYTSMRDEIHMPARDQFPTQAAYYGTALHELGHWTGHESRLNRKLGNSFGSPDYAKEELRAELASYFLADQLGIPHEPGQHAAYVNSWIQALEQDHNEIFRAAADAQKITEYVLSLDRDIDVDKDAGRERGVREVGGRDVADGQDAPAVRRERREPQAGDIIISAPFKSRAEVAQLGAEWAPEAKTWYVPPGVDADKLAKFAPHTPFEQWEANGRNHAGQAVERAAGQDVAAPAAGDARQAKLAREPQAGDIIISAPFKDRREARELGAEWAKEAQTWYVPPSVDADKLAKFAPHTPFEQWEANGRQHAVQAVERAAGQDVAAPAADDARQAKLTREPQAGDIIISAPFKDRREARELGAEWAKEAQTWYVPPGVDADKLAKFAPHTPFEQWEANGRQHAAQAVDGPAVDPEQAARDARLHYDQRAMSRDSTPQENAKNREAWKIAEGQAMLHELEAREKAVERGQDSAPVPEPAAEPERAKRRPLREPDLAKGDVILAVPYKDRAEAGRLGAEWAPEAKTWYLPAGVEQGPLQKWLPKGHDVAQGVAQDPHAAFGAELRAFGLVIDGEPIMDGKLHRVPLVDGKPKGRDGAYVGHLDGRPAGYMQNFVTGEKRNWKLDGPELSAEQKAELAAQAAIAKQRRAAELNSQHETAAKRAQERWDRAEEMPRGTTTPYLDRKQVPALGVRREGANMLVPARDIHGKLWSVQTIFPQKKELEPGTEPLDKVFTKGARKEGNFHMLGSVREGEPILVMEGYATGASANMATGYAVAVAFDSGNLEAVTGALKEKYPTNAIFIGADDDRFQKPGREFRNAGLQKAIEAAYQHDVGVIVPMFSTDGKLTDFNDLHVTEGLTEVKEQIHRGIAVTMEQSRKEAERIVAQQLGEQAPVRTPGPNTRHTGEVLGVTGYHVAQHTGRDGTVHRTQDLDRRPEAGTVATVQYKGGRGKVTDKTQEQQKEKSISR